MHVVFFGGNLSRAETAIKGLDSIIGEQVDATVLVDSEASDAASFNNYNGSIKLIHVKPRSDIHSVEKALTDDIDYVDAVVCTKEILIPVFAKLVGLLKQKNPKLILPSSESLLIADDKSKQRKLLADKLPSVSAKYTLSTVSTCTTDASDMLEEAKSIIIKPLDSYSSRYVIRANSTNYRQQLDVFIKAQSLSTTDQFLIEHFLEGEQYSVDGYVDGFGKAKLCPLVRNLPASELGDRGWYGAVQYAPVADGVGVPVELIEAILHTFGLRNSSFHLELKQEDSNWKVIELAARVGGFRAEIYEHSYGFNHLRNDLLNRIDPSLIEIHLSAKRGSAAIKHYPESAGALTEVHNLESLDTIFEYATYRMRKQLGDTVRPSWEGGTQIVEIIGVAKDATDIRSKAIQAFNKITSSVT